MPRLSGPRRPNSLTCPPITRKAPCGLWPLPPLIVSFSPKVLDQNDDAIAVHVIRVLTCVMRGSPSAKVSVGSGDN